MKCILIVDENSTSLKENTALLQTKYMVAPVTSWALALELLQEKTPDLILLNLHKPYMKSMEILDKITQDEKSEEIPLICMGTEDSSELEEMCLGRGVSDYIKRPVSKTVLQLRISKAISQEEYQDRLRYELKLQEEQLDEVTEQAIMAIANTIDAKDIYTKGHSIRVAWYAVQVAKKLKWTDKECRNLYYAALLHDIGKIGIPDAILGKTGLLTREEYEIIKAHTTIGGEILKEIAMIPEVSNGALYHHEHYNGKGYPYGVSGEDIPLMARIISVVDAYDAMSNERAYRGRVEESKIIEELNAGSGVQFDPALVEIMLHLIKAQRLSLDKLEKSDNVQLFSKGNSIVSESNRLLQKVLEAYTKEVKQTAGKDSLTGLYNRGSTEAAINAYLKRKDARGTLFMIDLDEFKTFNDTFGHMMGDELLQRVGDILRQIADKGDVAGRIGGDEFVIFFRKRGEYDFCVAKAKQLLELLKEYATQQDAQNAVSASIGIAIAPEDGSDFSTLYQNADKSLYVVKNKGKNSYHFYREHRKEHRAGSKADLTTIKQWFEEGDADGSYDVDYFEFGRIYHFITRTMTRNDQQVELLMISLEPADENEVFTPEVLREYMRQVERVIRGFLRMGDVVTEYSNSQFLVILMNASQENGIRVAERIISEYNNIFGSGMLSIKYDVQEIGVHAN